MSGKVMRTPENRVLKFQNPTIKIKEIDFDTMKSVARTVSGIELSEDVINLIFAIFDDDDSKAGFYINSISTYCAIVEEHC